jgi:predicted NAD/FAD-binding protein
MSALDNVSGQQFLSVKRMGKLSSGDFAGYKMNELTPYGPGSGLVSSDARDGVDQKALTADIAEHGVFEPISLETRRRRGAMDTREHVVVSNGHHRYIGAAASGQEKVPVDLHPSGSRKATMQDVVHSIAHYTPPGER